MTLKTTRKIDSLQCDFSHLIHTFNEQISNLRGELEHIKKYGDKAKETPREKVILCDYFKSPENK